MSLEAFTRPQILHAIKACTRLIVHACGFGSLEYPLAQYRTLSLGVGSRGGWRSLYRHRSSLNNLPRSRSALTPISGVHDMEEQTEEEEEWLWMWKLCWWRW